MFRTTVYAPRADCGVTPALCTGRWQDVNHRVGTSPGIEFETLEGATKGQQIQARLSQKSSTELTLQFVPKECVLVAI